MDSSSCAELFCSTSEIWEPLVHNIWNTEEDKIPETFMWLLL